VPVHRYEIYEDIKKTNVEAGKSECDDEALKKQIRKYNDK